MNVFVGITDKEWFNLLSSQEHLQEVNFWQPSGNNQFKALKPGEIFLFKLHSPYNFIVGGGVFAHSSILPISLAWEAFGLANGAMSLLDMRFRVEKYRRQPEDRTSDYPIGCILLEEPFFLPKELWIPVPNDWKSNIVRGRRYDVSIQPGISLWKRIEEVMHYSISVGEESPRYGKEQVTLPRLGQGSFRVLVTDAYAHRCAISKERTLPALDAAHIKPFSENGPHAVNNGLLLRRDIHALFDQGYITISPTYSIEVSKRIKEEFENGRDYYQYHGKSINFPSRYEYFPSHDYLDWHNLNIFKG